MYPYAILINIYHVEEINSPIRHSAYDISLYIVADDPLDSAIKLNANLSRIEICAGGVGLQTL